MSQKFSEHLTEKENEPETIESLQHQDKSADGSDVNLDEDKKQGMGTLLKCRSIILINNKMD